MHADGIAHEFEIYTRPLGERGMERITTAIQATTLRDAAKCSTYVAYAYQQRLGYALDLQQEHGTMGDDLWRLARVSSIMERPRYLARHDSAALSALPYPRPGRLRVAFQRQSLVRRGDYAPPVAGCGFRSYQHGDRPLRCNVRISPSSKGGNR